MLVKTLILLHTHFIFSSRHSLSVNGTMLLSLSVCTYISFLSLILFLFARVNTRSLRFFSSSVFFSRLSITFIWCHSTLIRSMVYREKKSIHIRCKIPIDCILAFVLKKEWVIAKSIFSVRIAQSNLFLTGWCQSMLK